MRVLRGDPTLWEAADPRGSAVSIGVFDGVHRGHQEVLSDLAERAEGRRRVVLTFDPHPLAVLTPGHEPPLIGSLSQRIDWLSAAGVDVVGVLPFSEIRDMDPADFVERVLVKGLQAQLVVVGRDFRYGRGREGTIETLTAAGEELGFVVDAVPLLTEHDGPLSSSSVRILVEQGALKAAADILGRPFTMRGVVVPGDGRGRTIGVPTANLDIDPAVLRPRRGVYATRAVIDGRRHPSVTNVGVRPTFDGEVETVETHVLDGEFDLYGRTIDLEFIQPIRDEMKFDGVDRLVAQIRDDVESARSILGGT